jgi:mannose-6-phosphate isomerase-like protein (cupin superfamily)
MSDYTIKNLKADVDDAAPKFDMSPDVEARFARETLDLGKLGLSYQRLAPNARMPFGHKHSKQEEVYVILEGSGRVKIEDDVKDVGQWDAIRVGPDETRAFEAGSDGLSFLAVGAGEQNDAEMIQGWW